MKKYKDYEAELNAIRLKLYEETKHMTAAEHTQWSNDRTQKLAAQYGFKIGKPSDKMEQELVRSKMP